VDNSQCTSSTATNFQATSHSQTQTAISLSTVTIKSPCVLEQRLTSQTPGLSPSGSIRSPGETGLSPKTPFGIPEILNSPQLAPGLDWQRYKGQKSEEQGVLPKATSLARLARQQTTQEPFIAAAFVPESDSREDISQPSPESLEYSPVGSAFANPVSEPECPLIDNFQGHIFSAKNQIGQAIVRQTEPSTRQPSQERKNHRVKSKEQLSCSCCNRIFARRTEFKYASSGG
jgi:hypothetical protein